MESADKRLMEVDGARRRHAPDQRYNCPLRASGSGGRAAAEGPAESPVGSGLLRRHEADQFLRCLPPAHAVERVPSSQLCAGGAKPIPPLVGVRDPTETAVGDLLWPVVTRELLIRLEPGEGIRWRGPADVGEVRRTDLHESGS